MYSRVALAGLGVIVLGIGFFAYRSQATSPVTDARDQVVVRIVLGEEGFQPRSVRVSTGTRIVFSTTRPNQFWPASNSHPAHELNPAFDPKRPLNSTEIWEHTFNEQGVWGYHDHVRSYYIGTIYVE